MPDPTIPAAVSDASLAGIAHQETATPCWQGTAADTETPAASQCRYGHWRRGALPPQHSRHAEPQKAPTQTATVGRMATHTGHDRIYVLDSPYEVARWRLFVNWLLYIPHGIVSYPLSILNQICGILNWFHLLFIGRLSPGLWAAQAGSMRYQERATGFLLGYSPSYAPFDFNFSTADNGAYPPMRINFPDVPERTSRKALFNFILAIPHYVVLAILAIGAGVVLILGWFAVLILGSWPQGMRDFLVDLANYWYRIEVYVSMVETRYPKFGL